MRRRRCAMSTCGSKPKTDAEWRAGAADARAADLGRARHQRTRRRLPALPIGRHRLFADDVACELTIAPREAYLPESARRRRFGFSAQLYAQRRSAPGRAGDRRFHHARPARRIGWAGRRGGARRQSAACSLPRGSRTREPLLSFRSALPRSDPTSMRSTAAACRATKRWRRRSHLGAERSRMRRPPNSSNMIGLAPQGGFAEGALGRLRARAPRSAATIRYSPNMRRSSSKAAIRCAASPFSRRSPQAAGRIGATGRSELRRGDASGAQRSGEPQRRQRSPSHSSPNGSPTGNWPRRGARQSGRSRIRLLSRPRRRRRARWRGGLGARRGTGGGRLGRRAARSVFGERPELAPAAARPARRRARRLARLVALYAANMRHAGLLRIDHAMGLARLFVIPDGAKPAEGAYLAYPARRSHRPYRAGEPARTIA